MADAAARRSSDWVDVPGGTRDAGRRPRRDAVRMGQRVAVASAAEVAAFAIERHDVTNAQFLEFVDSRRLSRPTRGGRPTTGSGFSASGSRHPLFWER